MPFKYQHSESKQANNNIRKLLVVLEDLFLRGPVDEETY